jgi:hypothetical protein
VSQRFRAIESVLRPIVLFLAVLAPSALAQSSATSSDPLANEPGVLKGQRSITAEEFKEQLEWWAHDDRGGREPGTAGNIEAGNVAAAEFQRLGLLPHGDVKQGKRTYFQEFDRGGKTGFDPAATILKIAGKKWTMGGAGGQPGHSSAGGSAASPPGTPVAPSGNFTLPGRPEKIDVKNLPVVFAGYGIRSKRFEYDDYRKVKVKGKAVLIFTHEPQEMDARSRWAGTKPVPDARLYRKMRNARRAGAKLLIMVDGPLHRDPAKDPLTLTGLHSSRSCPALHVRRAVAEALLEGTGKTLEDLQRAIDEKDAPASMPLEVKVSFQAERKLIRPARNVLALFPGSDPRLKREVIIIGAHYDHLGVGLVGMSRAPLRRGEIHNGADDNATGSVGVLELAEAFAESGVKTRRSILFILFDAEEKGLYGSLHYVAHPSVPFKKIAAMINMDMIGHVRNSRMNIYGTGTCKEWQKIIAKAEHGSPLQWSHNPRSGGGSDHRAFVQKRIPVLMFNSGLHAYYHTPDDDAARCNPEGAQEVLRVLFRIAYLTANLPRKLEWTDYQPLAGSRSGVRIGLQVKTAKKTRGARIVDVIAGTPAAKAGLKMDDVITKVGKLRVTGRLSYRRAFRRARPGSTVTVQFVRGGEKKKVKLTFPANKKPARKKDKKKSS